MVTTLDSKPMFSALMYHNTPHQSAIGHFVSSTHQASKTAPLGVSGHYAVCFLIIDCKVQNGISRDSARVPIQLQQSPKSLGQTSRGRDARRKEFTVNRGNRTVYKSGNHIRVGRICGGVTRCCSFSPQRCEALCNFVLDNSSSLQVRDHSFGGWTVPLTTVHRSRSARLGHHLHGYTEGAAAPAL